VDPWGVDRLPRPRGIRGERIRGHGRQVGRRSQRCWR
jgi:hypothetical protein